ncbi:MAG: hypothetical protein V4565_09000 [Bacteroidota bacterium]
MNTLLDINSILEEIRIKLEFFSENNEELDIVSVDLGTNKIMINHEHPYLLNQAEVEIPSSLENLFRIEKKEGHYNVMLKNITLDELMAAFQDIYLKNR